MKHTPGPWRVKRGPWKYHVSIKTESGEQVAETTVYNDEEGYNAQLIAAAPDLLEALKALVSAYCVSPSCQKGVVSTCVCDACNQDRARAAIDKAEKGDEG